MPFGKFSRALAQPVRKMRKDRSSRIRVARTSSADWKKDDTLELCARDFRDDRAFDDDERSDEADLCQRLVDCALRLDDLP